MNEFNEYNSYGNLIKKTDNRGQNITLSYDTLNRMRVKSYKDITTNYNLTLAYDGDYYGTLSNLSLANINVRYQYDDRLRITKAVMNISTYQSTEEYVYDSSNRLVSSVFDGVKRDYILNPMGKVTKIGSLITNIQYNPLSQISNKTYGNGKVTKYTYDGQNARLTGIYAQAAINLTYTYDKVGNIMSIIDVFNNLNYSMTYDGLDRMDTVAIGPDRYSYSFNAIGNIKKIVKNNESRYYQYDGLAHAPTSIVSGLTGVEVSGINALDTRSRNRTYEFTLINDKNQSQLANFSVNFGNGNTFTSNNINITGAILAFVETNYSNAGSYQVNVTTASAGASDKEWVRTTFGVRAKTLLSLYTNVTEKIFEFLVYNDMNETARDISWNCTNNITSFYTTNLSSYQSLSDYINYIYNSSGTKTFTCTVRSKDGNDSKTIIFDIPGLKVDSYNVMSTNISRRVIEFKVNNYYFTSRVNISINTSDGRSSYLVNMSQDSNILAFAELNFSSDGDKQIGINVSTNGTSDYYEENFRLDGVAIQNYQRVPQNYTRQVIIFDVVNKWYNRTVNWSIDNPNLGNVTLLNTNEPLIVIIENNYTQQGNNQLRIAAASSTLTDYWRDLFEVRPLKIDSLQYLASGMNSVSEIAVRNNAGASQNFNWRLNTGRENITSSLTAINDTVLVFIELNYTQAGVYQPSVTVNSTAYNDTESTVVVI